MCSNHHYNPVFEYSQHSTFLKFTYSHSPLPPLAPGNHLSAFCLDKFASMLLEISGKITPERMKRRSQSKKNHPVVDMTGDGSQVWYCKEQYCIGTRNVRTMNQGKLKVVKQEMARVNIDILGISELKWTGMGKFNSDDHLT